MNCNKGGQTADRSHNVTTLAKAKEWWPGVLITDLPLTIDQYEAPGGRLHIKIFDRNLVLKSTRG